MATATILAAEPEAAHALLTALNSSKWRALGAFGPGSPTAPVNPPDDAVDSSGPARPEPHSRHWSPPRASMWPVGCNPARRRSIYDEPELPPAVPDVAYLAPSFLFTGKFVVDDRHTIGSTTLVHGWDSSTSPMARLTVMPVPPGPYAKFLQNEGRVLVTLRAAPHRNLPTLVACRDPGSSDDTGNGFVFCNPMYGDLYGEARAPRPLGQMLRMFGQMVAAVTHCHAHGIVLGSLKLGKFMFADRARSTIQLADLAGARLVGPAGQVPVAEASGSPAYIAPEILGDAAHYDGFAADVWSLGVVCFVLLTGSYPFEDTSSSRLFRKIKAAEVTFPASIPGPIERLLTAMLCRDPADRLSAAAVDAHPVLAQARAAVKRPAAASASAIPAAAAAAQSLVTTIDEDTDGSNGCGGQSDGESSDASPVVVRRRRRSSASLQIRARGSEYVEDDVAAVRRCSAGSKRGSWCADLDDYEDAVPTGDAAVFEHVQPKRANDRVN